jgi:hypothetical protein
MQRMLVTAFVFIFSAPVAAETLTAVCKDPIGRISGQHGGPLGNNQIVDEDDRMKGTTVTIIWHTAAPNAQILVAQTDGAAATPLPEKGVKVHASEEQVSFIVDYPAAVWLYSLFPAPRLLLMTSHVNGVAFDSGGAINKSMKARCEISIN